MRQPWKVLIATAVVTPVAVPVLIVLPTVPARPAPTPVAPEVATVDLEGMGAGAASTSGASGAADAPALPEPSAGEPVVVSEQQDTQPYRLVAVTWEGETVPGTTSWVRHRSDGQWSTWYELPSADEHGPDPDSAEALGARGGTDPLIVPESDGVQVRVDTATGAVPDDLRLDLVDPGTSPADAGVGSTAGTAAAQAPRPTIYSRGDWGADESLRGPGVDYGTIGAGFVHHTVNANSYSAAEVPAIIRSIYAYHVQGRGWKDVGYNFLVDRFGRVWEGRYGGIDRPVIGAHTLGYNDDAFAMSAIGTYTSVAPSAAMLDAFAWLFAWKLERHGVDPRAVVSLDGTVFNAVSGHRDAASTECPGTALYAKLPQIRSAARVLQNTLPSVSSIGRTSTPQPPQRATALSPPPAGTPRPWYVRASYANDVFAVDASGVPRHVSWEGYVAAGLPTVYVVAAVPQTRYVRAPWSPAVFAVLPNGRAVHLAGPEWTAAGSPSPETRPSVPGSTYVRTQASPAVYALDPGGGWHWLTGAEWTAAGSPGVAWVSVAPGARYVKTPNSSAVYAVAPDLSWRWINAADFAAAGSPRVLVVAAVPGSRYVKTAASPTVYAIAPDGSVRAITYPEYVNLGPPAVSVVRSL